MFKRLFAEAVAAEAIADDLQSKLDQARRENHPDLQDIEIHVTRRIAEQRASAEWAYGVSDPYGYRR